MMQLDDSRTNCAISLLNAKELSQLSRVLLSWDNYFYRKYVPRNIRRFVFAHMANRCSDNLIEFAIIVQHTIFVSAYR